MNKRLFAALGCAAIALLGIAAAAWGQDLVFPIEITRIAVEGNDHVSTRDVEKSIALEVGDVLAAYSDLQPVSQAILDSGWFSEVNPILTQDGEVTFRVVENPVIRKIEITGNTHTRDISLFGVKLFSVRLMPTWRIRQALRENDIRVGETYRSSDLSAALQAVVDAYKEKGYILVMIGDVRTGETLSIDIIEGRVASHRITGLSTVPVSVAEEMIDLPSDEVLRQADFGRVATALRMSVYFSSVNVTPSAGPTVDSVVLNWTLTERLILAAPAVVRSIVLEGVTQFPADVAAREIGALPESTADNYAILAALEGVFDLYTRAGFVMIRFSAPRLEGDVLRLRVDEGMVSEIALDEKTLTQRRVLDKTLEIHVGRILTRNDLRVSDQKLRALGYFDNISIDPRWTDAGVRVLVSLTDKTTLGGLNGSLAFEPATGGLVGELSAKQRNILGSGQDVSLTYKRGVSPEGKPEATTWELGYGTLATWSEFDQIAMDFYRKTEDRSSRDDDESAEAQTYLTLGGDVRFSYPVADYADFVVGYRHELERKLSESLWQPVDALTLSLQEDSTDDPIFPTRGARRAVSLEKAGGFAVGKEYTKLDATWTWFLPFYDEFLPPAMGRALAVRLKAGFGDEGLSGPQAYELGGPTTVRGLDGDPVQRMAVANLEHRLKLADGFVLTAFVDAGMDLDALRLDAVKASTGLELGIFAAGVYVRLDVVWSLSGDASWVPKFDFGFGPMF